MTRSAHVFDTSGTAGLGTVSAQFYAVIGGASYPIGNPVTTLTQAGSWGLRLAPPNDASSGFTTSFWSITTPAKDAADITWNVVVPAGGGGIRSLATSSYQPSEGTVGPGDFFSPDGSVLFTGGPGAVGEQVNGAAVVGLIIAAHLLGGAPSTSLGNPTDYVQDLDSPNMWGPKVGTVWPTVPINNLGGAPNPAAFGYMGWTIDPQQCTSGLTVPKNTLMLIEFIAAQMGNAGHLDYQITTMGAGLTTAENWIGIFDAGQTTPGSATLLASSVDQTTAWESIGVLNTAMVSAASLVVGQKYFVGAVCNGTTAPTIVFGNSVHGLIDAGLTGLACRVCVSTVAATTLPGAVTAAQISVNTASPLCVVVLP